MQSLLVIVFFFASLLLVLLQYLKLCTSMMHPHLLCLIIPLLRTVWVCTDCRLGVGQLEPNTKYMEFCDIMQLPELPHQTST